MLFTSRPSVDHSRKTLGANPLPTNDMKAPSGEYASRESRELAMAQLEMASHPPTPRPGVCPSTISVPAWIWCSVKTLSPTERKAMLLPSGLHTNGPMVPLATADFGDPTKGTRTRPSLVVY